MNRAAHTLDETDRRIVNALQDGLALTPRPYAPVARDLEISEDELLRRLERLLETRAITRFGPFFDAAAMGGAFCLCAMDVPGDRFDAVVDRVNAHPEVAHNYAREHRLNMWFVLATETEDGIEATAQAIEAETGLRVYLFPKLQEFFIGFRVAA